MAARETINGRLAAWDDLVQRIEAGCPREPLRLATPAEPSAPLYGMAHLRDVVERLERRNGARNGPHLRLVTDDDAA